MVNVQSEYNGIPYADIVRKYWEMFNEGKEPVEGDRNVKTFELAVTLRSICDYSPENTSITIVALSLLLAKMIALATQGKRKAKREKMTEGIIDFIRNQIDC